MSTAAEMISGPVNGAGPDGGEAGPGQAGLPADFPVPVPPGAHVEMFCGRYVLAYGPRAVRFSCPTLEDLYDVMIRAWRLHRSAGRAW